jgi:hypothetical protein
MVINFKAQQRCFYCIVKSRKPNLLSSKTGQYQRACPEGTSSSFAARKTKTASLRLELESNYQPQTAQAHVTVTEHFVWKQYPMNFFFSNIQ